MAGRLVNERGTGAERDTRLGLVVLPTRDNTEVDAEDGRRGKACAFFLRAWDEAQQKTGGDGGLWRLEFERRTGWLADEK